MRVTLRTGFAFTLLVLILSITSCSHEEEVRMPQDIEGVWSPGDSRYLQFMDNYTVRALDIEEFDGEKIALWNEEVYFYEPGYNLVIYLTFDQHAEVYQIVDLNSEKFTWCWIREINIEDANGVEGVGKIIGDLIKEAQDGFKLDPELYQTFRKVSSEEFRNIIDSLGGNYPW